ncbi:MAG: PD-(D/E)XK nuclease family protein, partial [Oscillospiraceae bacterium]
LFLNLLCRHSLFGLTLPTEYLCLSCPETNTQGDRTELSEIMGKCQALFKDLKIKSASSFGNEFYCRSERAAKSRFAMHIKDNTYENEVLKNALIENNCKEFVERLNTIRSEHQATAENAENIGKHAISPEYARLLFPNKMGATSIEKLSACPFSFFVEQGLGVREKNRRTFNSSKRGDAIHFVLEKTIKNYSGDLTKLCGLNRAELTALVKHYLAEYCELETNNTFAEDARSRFLFENIANSAVDVLISMQAEFYSRGYRPKFFELSLEKSDEKNYITDNDGKISSELPSAELYSEAEEALPKTAEEGRKTESYLLTAPLAVKIDDELTVLITGRIDRVDMFTINDGGKDKTYVRAVDYKSSVHTFNLCNALNGINIQMLLYLIALLDANKSNPTVTLTAGGLSYIPSKSSGAQDSEISPFKLLAINHHESSLLVKDENTDNDLRNYKEFILKRIAEEEGKAELLSAEPSSLTPEQQKECEQYRAYLAKLGEAFEHNDLNSIEADKFDELRNDTIEFLREKLDVLFSGSVDAIPLCHIEEGTDLTGKKSKSDPCHFCRFGDICKNAGKVTAEIDLKYRSKYNTE